MPSFSDGTPRSVIRPAPATPPKWRRVHVVGVVGSEGMCLFGTQAWFDCVLGANTPRQPDRIFVSSGHRDALDSRLTNHKQAWDLCSPPRSCLVVRWVVSMSIHILKTQDVFQMIGRQVLYLKCMNIRIYIDKQSSCKTIWKKQNISGFKFYTHNRHKEGNDHHSICETRPAALDWNDQARGASLAQRVLIVWLRDRTSWTAGGDTVQLVIECVVFNLSLISTFGWTDMLNSPKHQAFIGSIVMQN